jgi:hypothetical protein
VADLLGCSVGNVKSQSARGLDKLRAVLGEAGLAEGPAGEQRTTGKPGPSGMAITPNGRTLYVVNQGSGT